MPRQYLRLDYDPADGLMDGWIEFGGRAVNLNRLAEQEGFDYSYLWRVMRGVRVPSIPFARKLSKCLSMTYIEFLTQLDKNTDPDIRPAE